MNIIKAAGQLRVQFRPKRYLTFADLIFITSIAIKETYQLTFVSEYSLTFIVIYEMSQN